jgi:hypothetical protein
VPPLPLCSPARCTDLVGTETLQGVVSKLVSHIHQAVVGVDVVQTVGLSLARSLADILAVPEETMEVELVGVLAVRGEARIARRKPQPRRSLASQALPACVLTDCVGVHSIVTNDAIKRNAPGCPPVQQDDSTENYRSQHASLPPFRSSALCTGIARCRVPRALHAGTCSFQGHT